MAKKSMVEREKKRQKLVYKYASKRASLKKEIKNTSAQSNLGAIKVKIYLHFATLYLSMYKSS
jgi:predicted transcriptional regulator